MGLRFDPVGGGQFKQLVEQLAEAERKPVKNLEARKAIEEQRMKLFQEFKNKFTGFQTALEGISSFRKLVEYKADLGDGTEIMDVTIDKEKVKPGSYNIRVEELAERSSMISNGFEDPNARNLGIGYVVVYSNSGDSFEVFVDEENSSLRGIANLINQQKDSPVQATVIQDVYDPEKKWKLIVTAKKDGDMAGVEFPEFYFIGGDEDFWIDEDKDSKNAYLEIDGFPIELAANDVSDFIEGVNIHLKSARPDRPFTLTIREDVQKVSGKVEEMVKQMNTVLEFINKQNKVDERSDTRTTFTGDTGLQSVEYRFRNLLHEGFAVPNSKEEGDYRRVWMNQMGIQFNKSGSITFDKEKFEKAIEDDFNGVAEAISGEGGFVSQMRTVLSGYTQPLTGLLSTRERSMRERINSIDRNIDQAERRADQRVQSLVERFSRLQSTLGAMQQQQQYLQASLGGGGNTLQQLIGG